MRRSPSALTVASCLGERPMMLRTRVTLSFFATRSLLAIGLSPLATARIGGLQAFHPPKRVHRRLEYVVRIVRAERLGQDVLDSGGFEHRADGAAGDDASSLGGRLQVDSGGAEVSSDLARNRRCPEGHEQEILLGVFHRLPYGLVNLPRLPQP